MSAWVYLMLNNLAIIVTLMVVVWLLSTVWRDVSIVDPVWGLGFVVVGWSTWLQLDDLPAAGWCLLALVSLWGLRLFGYLAWRHRRRGEDRRYAAMRAKHGAPFWWISLFTVFLLQALLLWLISLPIQAGMAFAPTEWNGWIALGGLVWVVGFVFESIGDYQMARFRQQQDGSRGVMDQGLWRYTRHPNYFGAFCVWWGHYGFALAAGAWWTLFSPVIMSILLMRVSGVTLLEKDISERRPEYLEYQRRTNAFFPWFPRERSTN